LVAVASAGALAFAPLSAAAALPVAPQARAVAPPKTTIAWGPCQDPDLKHARAQCGFIRVPLDWGFPSGAKISLAVSRLRADPAARQGVLLTNPGGPGSSGLALPAYLAPAVPFHVGDAYDWIGFDPRGVGASRPAVTCDPDYWVGPRPAYEPVPRGERSAAERAWVNRSRAYAAACGAKNRVLLQHMRTIDTVRDMDALRVALGEKQINFYGFSYGTFLGQAYATRYPGRVRRMVLDGNVPPTYPRYGDAGRAQTVAFEAVINEFFGWVAAHDAAYGLGTDTAAVRGAYENELRTLTKRPVRGIGAAEWADVIGLAGQAESLWPEVADAFADWRSGKYYSTRGLYQYADTPGDDNSYAAFLATHCSDSPMPRIYQRVRADAVSIAEQAPLTTWGGTWFGAPCTWWPVAAGRSPRIDGSRLPVPILLIQATGDGLAPYAGAVAVRREFPTASLVAEQGATTHAGSLFGNLCIDDTIAVYLADGTVPRRSGGDGPDKSCARMPIPEPSAKDRSVAADPPSQFPGPPPQRPATVEALIGRIVGLGPDTQR
jgi:pimeloyl-ACP methyl ester carboxylesterase